jgi:hypothetical protein
VEVGITNTYKIMVRKLRRELGTESSYENNPTEGLKGMGYEVTS